MGSSHLGLSLQEADLVGHGPDRIDRELRLAETLCSCRALAMYSRISTWRSSFLRHRSRNESLCASMTPTGLPPRAALARLAASAAGVIVLRLMWVFVG